MTDYVLTGLVKRRAEMAGELERAHEAIRKLVVNLEHLDAAIRIIAPDFEPEGIAPKVFRPPDDWSKHGQMSRMVLSILRTAKEPLTSREIASRMILDRGLARDDKWLRLMTKRFSTPLRARRSAGQVRSEQGPGTYALWELAFLREQNR